MFCYLSYFLTEALPIYGDIADLNLKSVKKLHDGDSCNTWQFCLGNHWGTHVDCPAHFFLQGYKISDYPPECWIFKRPQVIKINAKASEIITRDHFCSNVDSKSDLILFQSGWWKYRRKDAYCSRNPGLDPSIGLWLRNNYPQVRAIGLDWISISSFENKELGREAHRAFLNPVGKGHPVLIIEDMNLSIDLKNLKKVWVAPLLVEKIDSAPCTVIGILGDQI
jgi:arylformamidase